MILAERAARLAAEAEATHAKADLTGTEALIAHLKLAIEKLRRALYGGRSERQTRLLDQIGARAGGAGGRRERGRDRRAGCSRAGLQDNPGLQTVLAAPLPGASAARARRDRGAVRLPVLRVGEAVEARRGRFTG